MLPWKLRKRQILPVSQNLSLVYFSPAKFRLASHAGVFKGARFSSLPTNAYSAENNIRFPLFYLRGK